MDSVSAIAQEEFNKGINTTNIDTPLNEPLSTMDAGVGVGGVGVGVGGDDGVGDGDNGVSSWKDIVYTSWFWGLVTFSSLFIFLYRLNPPIVQYPKKETQILECPRPNPKIIFVLSLIGGLSVFLSPYISRWL